MFDLVIVGSGPAGLSAALALGRARKRVLLCDAGPRRNAAAVHMHNFVTRDGIAPREFRRLAREELKQYPTVEVRDVRVERIDGDKGHFTVTLDGGSVSSRRVLLATGMIDEPGTLPGLRALWGTSVFQCPYCHGWEVRDRRFGYLAHAPETAAFPLLLRGWSSEVVLFTDGRFAVPTELRAQLEQARVTIDERKISRLVGEPTLEQVELEDGTRRHLEVLFHHPPQRQVPLVTSLGLVMTEQGYVQADPRGVTSRPGIYAAGDLTTHVQAAIIAASAGMLAGATINHDLSVSLAERPELAATPPESPRAPAETAG